MKYFLYIFSILSVFLFANCSSKNEIKTIRIGMCSDVHLPTMHDSEKRISSFIDSMKIAKPDFIIELGDFGIPSDRFAPYFAIWNSFPGLKYHVIGNHEMDGGTSLDEAVSYRKMNNSYYTFSKNGFKFIVLDGNDKKDPNQKGYSSYMGKEQLAWVKQELKNAKDPIVIFSHQGIGTDPNNPGERYSIENSLEVRKIFEDHNKTNKGNKIICCFNGHTHHDFAEEIEGIWYITINSMSYKWLGEEYEHLRYSQDVDKEFKWIKFTAPYKDPLYTVVEISTEGYIKMSGKKTQFVGLSPWELDYPEHIKKYVKPEITERLIKFSME
jgi:3',5'-cyclic-AMP phosphodiesterase